MTKSGLDLWEVLVVEGEKRVRIKESHQLLLSDTSVS